MFRNAIVRAPASTFAGGLTSASLGPPMLEKALEQHARYCEALERCGLALTRLAPDLRFPDGTFVEDDAIVTPHAAILARPGAESRLGEVTEIREVLARFYPAVHSITEPGTLDGGDVCEVGDRFFMGISRRTNEEGARQLATLLEGVGYRCTFVDIREVPEILHLKSGIACVGEGRLVLIDALLGREEFRGYETIRVEERERYGANCVRVNDAVLLAEGHPALAASLSRLGYRVLMLAMSEFQKMDGGLSCLSLRF